MPQKKGAAKKEQKMNKTKAIIVFQDGSEIRLVLNEKAAPISVRNFTELAEKGYYDGLCFHRIIDGFMIQGGGFKFENQRLIPAPALKPIKGEFASNGVNNPIKHKPGVISMARTVDCDSATSQFFICVADCPFLDGEYAAFGECEDKQSIDTAIRFGKTATGMLPPYWEDVPREPVVIKTVKIER